MSSRRMMTRSYSADGRSSQYNGDDVNGSSRAGGRSYLSNVRPENRSTLCSVMAQLTEETQPSFETTLKSKAVSENCNVKFACMVTGHPTPEVTWYKDDMQLDRYCGLPKYEIFRNGQNHSLHIYNCTVEDAAIYQASASNNKGIVSCSGVLEVGDMNEFKIHQQYFAKLKQKAEHKRRELEGKENQGPELQDQLRPISPDRSQRKRRSPMEAFLSTPSSMEDEGTEESQQAAAAETEARLQETTMEEAEEKPVPITNGAVSPITNGNGVNENGSTYIYDSAQKIFTAHQPKTPFIKKKIKISNGAKGVKVEAPAERVSEEKRANEEASVALAPTQPLQSHRTLEEVMEVESTVTSSALDSDSRKVTEQRQKSATEKALPVNRMPSEEVKVCLEGNVGVPLQKEPPTVPISAATLPSTNRTVSGTKGKQAAELDKEVGPKDTFGNLKKLNPNPPVTSTQLHSSLAVTPQQPLSTVKEDITKTQQEDVTVMEVDKKSSVAVAVCPHPSTTSTLTHRDLESVDMLRESEDALPLRPCEQSTDQLSEKETSPSLKNASVSRPLLRSEVTQAHTQMNRNDAPVNLEPRPTQCKMDAHSPQKSPSGRETTTDDNQAPSLHSPVQAAFDKMTQDTWDHSRGSNESHTVLFTDLQKSPLESPGDGENTPGCNVSPTVQQSQVETAIKTVEGTEIQVDEKVKGNELGKLLVQADNLAPNECIVQMETEIVELKTLEQAKTEETTEQNSDIIIVDISDKETEKNEPVLKRPEEKHSESQNLKPTNLETVIPHITKTPENTSVHKTNLTEQPIKGFKEIPTPVPKVISIAELLRSQIKALESAVVNSVTTIPIPADQRPTTSATEKCQELRVDNTECKLEVKKSKLDREMETSTDASPPEGSLSMVEEFSKTDPLTPPNPEASPLLRKRNGVSPIPSATPQELASGARRKILLPKAQTEDSEVTSPADNQPQKEEVSTQSSKLSPGPAALSVSPSLSRRSPLLQPSGGRTSPAERSSPLLSRRKTLLETPAPSQQPAQQTHTPKTEGKPAEKDKHDPFKAPQVIRKIRGESFSDASGHLKLWCQFFNVLSDSTIKWYRDEVEIAQIKRNAGDETQINLAIVQASSGDCGVYGCTITNEHGTDTTDFLLSVNILAGISLREDLGVGEEIEMTPLMLNKGVADFGVWGNKFFGRIMMQESHIGDGCSHKVWRAKVIYGLEPVFESGNTCVIKVCNPITYGGKGESCLIERNLDTAKKECRIQNLAREYCKIFSAEARVIENFGPCLEVIPVYLMYRPANTVPHATVEADLKGVYLKYSLLDHTGRLVMRTGSEVEQKCCALQHWIHQWTNGNLLLTQLEGVDTKITNVGISVKSTGYQGLSATGNPKVFEQFVSQHQCNYYCGLLGLRSLKAMDSLMTPSKPKGSRSPLLQRKMAAGSSSPQTGRKSAGSPRLPRKAESEQDSSKTPTKQKAADAPKDVKMT
ncbi:alpha-protein kinase 3-like [Centroberyx affinis]|uniref:alpha-protein kinase 3-like n=1 Tax=Centroberyx affinis TaxID=166261 RepID=UPI003A5C3762